VKPRRVAVDAVARGLGLVPHFEQRCRTRCRERRRVRFRPPLDVTLGGYGADGLRLFRARPMPESEASGARERTLAPRFRMRGGDRTVGGRARGSSWLQKSTSGAWSWPKGHGSSPLAPLLTQASSAGESAPEAGSRRRKPPAREQRHRWRAPRDPTRPRASVRRARGREHSAMEGVLERCGPSSLTRRRPGRSRRPGAMGMRQRCRIRRGRTGASEVMSQARPAVENTAGGRFGAEEPSIGAPPGLRWTAHATLRGSRDGCSNGRSWRFAVKRSSTWLAHPASGSVDLPDLSGRRLRPRVSPC